MANSVLDGVRVLDFTSGPAGGLATTVLADFGAEVTKVEPPGGDRFRRLAASPFWLRGKRSVVIDLDDPDGNAEARTRAAAADVVVVSGPPSRLRRWGLDGSLCDTSRCLVHCTISGWGTTGPYAELPGYEGIVAAKSGRMAAFDVQLQQDRPVFAAVPVATHIASQAAVQGIVAALYQRQQTGVGAAVEASLVQALMPFDLVDLLARQISERDGRSFKPLRTLNPMPTLNYHPLRAKDGTWIQCGNLLEHLFYSFLDATDLLGEFLIEEQFQGSPATWSPEATEQARDQMLLRMQERTADEWMEAFAINGNVAAEPIVSSQEAMRHVDLVDGQGLVEIHDQIVGATIQIAPIAELSDTPANTPTGAPTVGQHNDELASPNSAATFSATPPSQAELSTAQPGRPLDGVTVLDLSTIIAAPLGASMLADLGARVIKVEPFGGDPFRAMLIEGRMAVKTNVGKESICINLKTAEGQGLLHELVVDADVLVHNFRGDVPDKLGIGYPQLKAINPDLIWAVVNGYGPHGPGAPRPATHPVMGACTGGVAHQAGQALTRDCPTLEDLREASRQIMAANEANPDPNTSVTAASAIALALFARRKNGGGQQVRINMQVANAWANSDDFLSYDGKPERDGVDAEHYGTHAGYRLYETADGWVFLAVTTDHEFTRFCLAAGCDLTSDDRFTSVSTRRANNGALARAIAEHFATRSASEWETQLIAAGVACVRADGIEVDRFIAEDAHMLANNWAPLADHTRFGRLRRWGPVVTVSGPNPNYRSAPLAGEHTDAILSELGHDDATIAALRAAKVVNSESP